MDDKSVEAHFSFGKNWESYSTLIDETRIDLAKSDLNTLITKKEIRGRSFLDIGCGSGLSMLAALKLGAKSVRGVDIDKDSVATARKVLSRYAPNDKWKVDEKSVFGLKAKRFGTFDIVHSWGVLHHTGAMWDAIENASTLVKPDGLLVLALYRKTKLCGFWRIEKKIYAHGPKWLQFSIQIAFKALNLLAFLIIKRQNPLKHIYGSKKRGMDWHHDIHDWLGGYPYESVSPHEIKEKMMELGFALKREILAMPQNQRPHGIFGSCCDEYVFQKKGAKK